MVIDEGFLPGLINGAVAYEGASLAQPLMSPHVFGLSRENLAVIVAVFSVVGVVLFVMSLFRGAATEDVVGHRGDINDDPIERLGRLERKVQRLSERVDGIDERVKKGGGSSENVLGSSLPSGTVSGGNRTQPEAPPQSTVSRDSSPQNEARYRGTRMDLARFAEKIVSGAQGSVLDQRFGPSRQCILSKIKSVLRSSETIDVDMLEEIEVLLVTSDLGIKMAQALARDLKEVVRAGGLVSKEGLIAHLHKQLLALLSEPRLMAPEFNPSKTSSGSPKVVVVVGVNGVGKTTTVGKLAQLWSSRGSKVVLGAADTFRAAADEQLREWGNRIGVEVISGAPDDKPSTVAHAAVEAGRNQGADVVIIDTAGRLHNRGSLMQELEGMLRAVKKAQPQSPEEVWLVLDGTTGQNALAQAREFQSSVSLTGVIVTKLDGTAKGGVVVGISHELGIPVRFIGIGESWQDLRPFNPKEFVTALLGDGSAQTNPL